MKKLTDDERINLRINSIYAIAFKILIVGMILDVIYKLFFKKENFTDVMDITILLLISLGYVSIMFINKGLFNIKLGEGKSSRLFIFMTSFLASIIFTILMNINSNINVKVIVMGIIFFCVVYFLLFIFTKLSNNKN